MQQQITFHCTPEEFRGIIEEAVERAVRPIITQAIQPQNNPKLLTRNETARFLGISLPTLHEWTKTGKITASRISTRVRYYQSDVENSLMKMKTNIPDI